MNLNAFPTVNTTNAVATAAAIAGMAHVNDRRADNSFYVFHPLRVWQLLEGAGHTDPRLAILSLLHDTIERDSSWRGVINTIFEAKVVELLEWLTVDQTLNAEERKRSQLLTILDAPAEARLVKLADRCDNVADITVTTPTTWPTSKKIRYLNHTIELLPAFLDLPSRLVPRLIDLLEANPLMTDEMRVRLKRTIASCQFDSYSASRHACA